MATTSRVRRNHESALQLEVHLQRSVGEAVKGRPVERELSYTTPQINLFIGATQMHQYILISRATNFFLNFARNCCILRFLSLTISIFNGCNSAVIELAELTKVSVMENRHGVDAALSFAI